MRVYNAYICIAVLNRRTLKKKSHRGRVNETEVVLELWHVNYTPSAPGNPFFLFSFSIWSSHHPAFWYSPFFITRCIKVAHKGLNGDSTRWENDYRYLLSGTLSEFYLPLNTRQPVTHARTHTHTSSVGLFWSWWSCHVDDKCTLSVCSWRYYCFFNLLFCWTNFSLKSRKKKKIRAIFPESMFLFVRDRVILSHKNLLDFIELI